MLNTNQQLIILDFIAKHNAKIKQDLIDMHMLCNEEDGTHRLCKNHNNIENWFLKTVNPDYLIRNSGDVIVEINGHDSKSGNPILFNFSTEEFYIVALARLVDSNTKQRVIKMQYTITEMKE